LGKRQRLVVVIKERKREREGGGREREECNQKRDFVCASSLPVLTTEKKIELKHATFKCCGMY
jgi:hypothetical protein